MYNYLIHHYYQMPVNGFKLLVSTDRIFYILSNIRFCVIESKNSIVIPE